MKSWRFFTLILFFAATFPAYAGVVINEVAWTGSVAVAGETANSAANREWIEFYSSTPQTLDGWILLAADGGMSINLSGTINGYYLLERSSDDSVPDIPANLIYTGALSNTGEILILKDAGGNEIDRVDGSENWAIGGNNTTKETLQKTATGWTTAAATPKAQNAGATPVSEDSNSSENSTQQTSSGGGGPVEMAESVSKLKAHAGEDRTVLAGAEVGFSASAEGFADDSINRARFLWNFGDGYVAEGKNIAHAFSYPGTYSVFLSVSSAGMSVSDSLKIIAVENPVVISEIKPGAFLEIYNNSQRKIDFSGFGVGLGDSKPFYFPAGTFLSPYAYLALKSDLLGFEMAPNGTLKLFYPNNKILFSSVYPLLAFEDAESLNFSDGNWFAAKVTPGEKNIAHSKSKTIQTAGSSQAKAIENIKPNSETDAASVISIERAEGLQDFLGGNYFWLFLGLGAGILAGLGVIFGKRYFT